MTDITTSHDVTDWREAFETTEPGHELDRLRTYYAAVHTDRLRQSAEAVIRLADREQAELVERITGATDDELTRRLEWATGRNGATLLAQIRAEGLDVIAVTPEQVAP